MDVKIFLDPIHHIIIDDFYSNEELKYITNELDWVYPLLTTPENSGGAKSKDENGNLVELKNNRALFLDALYKDEAASPIAAITSNKLMSEQFRDTVGAGISHYYDLYNLLNKKSFLISYYEKSNYYDYHHDLGLFTALTYLWKEPRAFEGGEIKFKLKDNTEFRPGIKNNRCIIFPSYIKHAAEEVYMDDSNLDQGMGRYCISCFLHFDLDKAHQDKENSISR